MVSERTLLRALEMLTVQTSAEAVSETVAPHFEAFRGRSRLRSAAIERVDRVRTAVGSSNVVGLGIASKSSGGSQTEDLAVVVYVRKKQTLKRLTGAEVVPPVLPEVLTGGDMVPTDVVQIGTPRPEVNRTRAPIRPGFSIGHFAITAGTLGAVVRQKGKSLLLSNSHVLANSGLAAQGDDVLYPGKADGGRRRKDVVGHLLNFIPFKAGGAFVNEVDCAIAELLPDRVSELDPAIFHLGLPKGVTTPVRGMAITKVGRTTDRTVGVVRDVNFRVKIDYGDVGTVGFTQQVLCSRYSEGGDSGSLVLDRTTKKAVGLHFGGSADPDNPVSFFNPIRAVLRSLKVTLVEDP